MKVFKKKPPYESITVVYHLVLKREWAPAASINKLISPQVELECGKKMFIEKGDTYEDFSKKKHRRDLCSECLSGYKKRNNK